ncbi:hypothetical protein BEP19_04345 [Ammoniphilus oxalaticus]|uniref:Membrane-anchored protein n=1 Tax=Ammoniphilus oxalaticus TaxID=66863 RepID=A0A419SLX2_9BACL|nr:GDYXXLXY domain-containing protein [Ammoniphilus oxalaticus]RKD25058.1 hypothetical protein BEP19_04345 [Ammoniphilus oxalaticus]
MAKTNKNKIFLVIGIQVLVLLLIVGAQLFISKTGDEIRLKTAPVDPRDVFYGDYVILNYEMSELDIRLFPEGAAPKKGATVYTVLKREGNYDRVVSAHLEKPKLAADEHMMKGRVDYVLRDWRDKQEDPSAIRSIRAIYGIERYYVPEGEGMEIENKRGQFDVLVKVTTWGKSISKLSFNAVDLISEDEAHQRVISYLNRQQHGRDYEIIRSSLADRYQDRERSVWIIEVESTLVQSEQPSNDMFAVIVDAISGDILEEKR